MKNLKFLVIALALVIGISSCKKEEKAAVIDSISIVGTWVLVKDVSRTYKDGIFVKEDIYQVPNIQVALTSPIKDGLVLKNDGTGDYYEKGGAFPITYSVQGNATLTIRQQDGKYTDTHQILLLNSTDLVYLETGTTYTGGYSNDNEYSLKRK